MQRFRTRSQEENLHIWSCRMQWYFDRSWQVWDLRGPVKGPLFNFTCCTLGMSKRKHPDSLRPRGGRNQRAAAAKSSGNEEYEPLATIGALSPCAFKFLEHWSWGNSSAFEIQELALAVERTFPKVPADVAAIASCGSHGHNAANAQRDMLRLAFLQDLKAPDPYYFKANVFLKSGAQTVVSQEEIAVFLPREWGHSLYSNQLLDQTFGEPADFKHFWKQVSRDDLKLYGNPILSNGRDKNLYIPVACRQGSTC